MNWLRRLFNREAPNERIREFFDEIRERERERERAVARVISSIDQALESETLTNDEAADLSRSSSQITSGAWSKIWVTDEIVSSMRALWWPPIPEELELRDLESVESCARTEPQKKREWSLALTDEFVKATGGIDRKLQGRILEALHQIANAPTSPRGDTVKALTGDLAGLWRFRIGDFRLIYKPDELTMRIYLLSFGGRGAVYH